jgi:putative CocE/NonD family hydrolase
MVDGWMGDDWFHYGAFRQPNLDYFIYMMSAREAAGFVPRGGYDDYESYLRAGSAGEFARHAGIDQLPWWQRLSTHPAYDELWQKQALDQLILRHPLTVPTLWIQGLWDQEDMWGAIHSYLGLKAKGTPDQLNHLVMGPWRHSQVNYGGYSLGGLRFEGDTARNFRRDILKPFFDQYLKDGVRQDMPAALIYNTGEDRWDRFKRWPGSCERGCAAPLTPIFLREDFALSFNRPSALSPSSDSYVSDPAKPVPFVPRPVRFLDRDAWKRWLVLYQRAVEDRTDVLTYETELLTAPVRISGEPVADLYAATSGTDADWAVKLIDVYPDEVPSQPELGGYELGIAMGIFRGRYRDDFAHPTAIPVNEVERYRFTFPPTNHVFLPGHRIMVQIQSSWFPLYDRNPQSFVPNIFFAQSADYVKATQQIFHTPTQSSAVWLPLIP